MLESPSALTMDAIEADKGASTLHYLNDRGLGRQYDLEDACWRDGEECDPDAYPHSQVPWTLGRSGSSGDSVDEGDISTYGPLPRSRAGQTSARGRRNGPVERA